MPVDVMGKNPDNVAVAGQSRAVPFCLGHAFDPIDAHELIIC